MLTHLSRQLVFVLLLATCSVLAACANPNGGGVQDYGSIQGTVIDAKTNAVPGNVTNATISVGDQVTRPSTSGVFNLAHIPIGDQPLTVRLDGYQSIDTTVSILKDQISDLKFIQLAPLTISR